VVVGVVSHQQLQYVGPQPKAQNAGRQRFLATAGVDYFGPWDGLTVEWRLARVISRVFHKARCRQRVAAAGASIFQSRYEPEGGGNVKD
jgi:hypothetical protein